jgi:hypothetical protein
LSPVERGLEICGAGFIVRGKTRTMSFRRAGLPEESVFSWKPERKADPSLRSG